MNSMKMPKSLLYDLALREYISIYLQIECKVPMCGVLNIASTVKFLVSFFMVCKTGH